MVNKRASILDVANRAGVSTATVSRYFNSRSKVSAQSAANIEKAIKELQYVCNSSIYNDTLAAPAERSNEIAIVGRDLTNQHFWQSYIEADSLAYQHGYVCSFYNLNMSSERQEEIFSFLARKKVAGIIALTMTNAHEAFDILIKNNIPVVLMDSDACVEKNVVACLKTNVYSGTYIGTNYLLSIGHRKIALINGPSSLYTSGERLKGYLDAIKEFGQSDVEPIVYNVDIKEEASYEKTVEIILQRPDITAIFPSTNQLTSGCYRALFDYHVPIPEQLSLMGYDDIGNVQFFNPPLTVVSRPHIRKKGYAAMSMMLSHLENKDCELPAGISFDMPMEIKIRQSCAPPNPNRR